MAPTAKKFPHHSLDPVPYQSIANLAAHSNPQSTLPTLIAFADNNKIG
jgi:hypothetical protein